ncbi:hypothetical protein [Lysinibacillus sp. UGB7]|uniref:hypothetical protein n=1 Tax=Lysinibacillus TaxID=400634 RepID=UPI0003A63A29
MLFPQKSPPALQSTSGRLYMIEGMDRLTKNSNYERHHLPMQKKSMVAVGQP